MGRLTCKYDGQNALRKLCSFDRNSDIEADDCLTCEEYCDMVGKDCKDTDYPCDQCAIQKAFDKLAYYEDREEKQRINMNGLVPVLKELKKELNSIQYDKSRFNVCRIETSYESRMAKITPDILNALQSVIEIYEGTEKEDNR